MSACGGMWTADDRWNLAGQIECRYSWGHTISCWSWNTLLHLLVLLTSAVLSIHKTEKLSDGVTAMSGTVGVSHVSVKQRMLQSLMSRWKLILALRSSILVSKYWTLMCRIFGRGGLWALFLSLLRIPTHFPQCFLIRHLGGLFRWPLFSAAFRSISNGHVGFVDKVSWNRLV